MVACQLIIPCCNSQIQAHKHITITSKFQILAKI